MLRWFVDGPSPPRQVECEEVGYPHEDAEGRKQYENTHFDDEDEAWAQARSEAEAGISISATEIREAEEKLARARARAAETVKDFDALMEAERRRKEASA